MIRAADGRFPGPVEPRPAAMLDERRRPGPADILCAAYRTSYPAHLGIEFPGLGALHRYPDLISCVRHTCGPATAEAVRARLERYERLVGPAVRLSPLLRTLRDRRLSDQPRVLDFGCGAGQGLAVLSRAIPGVDRICGVDVDLGELRSAVQAFESRETRFSTTLDGERFDLVTAVSTFHHISPTTHHETMFQVSNAVAAGGFLYLHEDSWAGEPHESRITHQIAPTDTHFAGLSVPDKRELFVLHERVSSAWAHGRALAVDAAAYRPLTEWMEMVRAAGLTIVNHGLIGFDPDRLHGVPAGWIVAQNRRTGPDRRALRW